MNLDDRLRARLDVLREQGLDRALPSIEHREGARYRLAGREVVGFCSNDYLGLADAPELHGPPHASNGASASRLIAGDLPIHREVEAAIAAWLGYPDAVLFPSGFQLNVGVLPALLESEDIVASDRLNHASIIDGLRLARARTTILAHGEPPPRPEPSPAHWWITESIFSMDGDTVDVAALQAHQAAGGWTYVDEAHALGLFARGLPLTLNHNVAPTLLVGTLSKALGSAGAFVAASRTTAHWIRTRARSFVFTTGTTPVLLPRVLAAIELVRGPEGDLRRAALWHNIRRFADHLAALGLPALGASPIFPVLIGDNAAAVRMAEALLDRGWHVQPIRPPTVPDGTARLRITVTAAHTSEDIDGLANALADVLPHRAAR